MVEYLGHLVELIQYSISIMVMFLGTILSDQSVLSSSFSACRFVQDSHGQEKTCVFQVT